MMQTIMWHKLRVITVILLVALTFFTLRVKWYTYTLDGSIKNVNPENVWEFVADFSNMKYLQPHLANFTIISESGNYDHWRYTVKYYEPLNNWPYTDTVGVGHYSVRAQEGSYVVSSVHENCFIGEWGCLRTEHEIILNTFQGGRDTYFLETIKYQCPVFLSFMCYNEVDLTRKLYRQNLIEQFSRK